jgi:hypothetical protein
MDPKTHAQAARDADLLETVLRHEIGPDQRKDSDPIFVAFSTGEAKLDKEILKRLASYYPVITAVTYEFQPGRVLLEPMERHRTIFFAGPVRWISETEAEVRGGYYSGRLDPATYVYSVKMISGKWKVTGEKLASVA